ncbi:MAG: hypothetical protein JRN38_02865, partial [Nitrososphaerota archaeon]|nr:hypothetical protein [Nitrososphaerota archaeon]
RKTIWTDEALFYPEACRLLRLEHRVYPLERKNLIERFNQALKDRLENFDDLFPCFREHRDHRHVRNCISIFRYFHNVIREPNDQPEYLRFIQSPSETLN